MRRGLPGGLGPGQAGREHASLNSFWQKAVSLLDDRERRVDTSSCVLPADAAAVFFQSAGWELPGAALHRNSLNDIKGLLDNLDNTTWDSYARLANYAEYVRRDLRKHLQVEMATIAWAKMYEVLIRYNLMRENEPSAPHPPSQPAASVPPSTTVHRASSQGRASVISPGPPAEQPIPAIVTVHLCEAPGGFVAACNHFLRTQRPSWHWDWLAVSLNPYYGGNDQFAMVDDDVLLQATLPHWCFGADDSGDVRRPENIRAIWVEARRRCDAAGVSGAALVTADGAVDSSMLPAVQELMNAPLLYCEVVAALGVLAAGGSLVVKVFTLLEHPSVCVMHLLGCLFEDVTVCKPCTSKACNGELYVIARGFRGVAQSVLEQLLSACGEDTFARGSMLPLNMLPPPFLRSTLEAAAHFAVCTGEAIRDALDKSGLPPNGPTANALRRVKERFAAEWFCRTQLLRLDRRYFLAPQEAFDGSSNSTSNVLGRRRELLGTLQERQEQYRRRRNHLGLDGDGLLTAAAAIFQGQLGSSYESAGCISLGSSPSGSPGLGSYGRSPGRGLGSVGAMVDRVSSSMGGLGLGLGMGMGLPTFLRQEVKSGDGVGDGDGDGEMVGAGLGDSGGGGGGGGGRGAEVPLQVSGTIAKLMAKMGCKEGAGLGRQLQGIAAAVPAVGNVGRAGLGLGSGTGAKRTPGLDAGELGAVRLAATAGLRAGLGGGLGIGELGFGSAAQDSEWVSKGCTPKAAYGNGLGHGVCEDKLSGCPRAGLGCASIEAGTEVGDRLLAAVTGAAVITSVQEACWAPAPDVRMLENDHPLKAAEVVAWTYDTTGAADVAMAAASPAVAGGLGHQVPPSKLIKSKMIVDDNVLVALRRARTEYNEAAATAAAAPATDDPSMGAPGAAGIAVNGTAHAGNRSISVANDADTSQAPSNSGTAPGRPGQLCKHSGPMCVAPLRRGAGAAGRSYWKLAALDCALGVCQSAATAAAGATGMVSAEVPSGPTGPHGLDLSLYSAGATDYLLGAAVMTKQGTATGLVRDRKGVRNGGGFCVSGANGGSHDGSQERSYSDEDEAIIGRADSTNSTNSSIDNEARNGVHTHGHHHRRHQHQNQGCSTDGSRSRSDVAAGEYDIAAEDPTYTLPECSPAPSWSVTLLASPAARAYARRLGEQHQAVVPIQHYQLQGQQPFGAQGNQQQWQEQPCSHTKLDRLQLLPFPDMNPKESTLASTDDLLNFLTPETSRAVVAAACANDITTENTAVAAAGLDTASPSNSSPSRGSRCGGGRKYCLVVGDLSSLHRTRCGWPASSGGPLEGEYDTLYRRRLLWEAATALDVLAPGGAVVLRLGDCLTMFSASVLYILHRSFARLGVVKPFASCACSPERFVVGLGRLEDGGVAAAQLLAGLQAVRQVEAPVPRGPGEAVTAVSEPAAAVEGERERDGDEKLAEAGDSAAGDTIFHFIKCVDAVGAGAEGDGWGGASKDDVTSLEPCLLAGTDVSVVREPRDARGSQFEDEEEVPVPGAAAAVAAASSSPQPVRPSASSHPHGANEPSQPILNASAPPFNPTSIAIRRQASFERPASPTPSPTNPTPTTPSPSSPYLPASATAAASSASVASCPVTDQFSRPMVITGVAPVSACVGGAFYVYLAGRTQELAVRQVRACEAALGSASMVGSTSAAGASKYGAGGGIGSMVSAADADPHEQVARQALAFLASGMAGAGRGHATTQYSSEDDPDADLRRKYGGTFTRGSDTALGSSSAFTVGSAPVPHSSWMSAAAEESAPITTTTAAIVPTAANRTSPTHGEQVAAINGRIASVAPAAAVGAPTRSLRNYSGFGIQRVAAIVAAGPPAAAGEGGRSWSGPLRPRGTAGARVATYGDSGGTSWSGQPPALLAASIPSSGRYGMEPLAHRPSAYTDSSSWHPPSSYGGSPTSASYIASGVNTPSGASTPYGTSPQYGTSLPCTSSLSLAASGEGTGAATAFIGASSVMQGPGLFAPGGAGGWCKGPSVSGIWGASNLPRPSQQTQYGRWYCNAERGMEGCGRVKATWGAVGRSNGSWRRADEEEPAGNWVSGPGLAAGGGCGYRGVSWGPGGKGQGRREGPRTPENLGRGRYSGASVGRGAAEQGRRPMRVGQVGSAEGGPGHEGPAASEFEVVVQESGWERVPCTGHRRRAQQFC